MRGTIITLSCASLLMLVSGTVMATENSVTDNDIQSHAAESNTNVPGHCYRDDSATKRGASQQSMFDGVKLTENQRQQMRDLMRQMRYEQPIYDANDVETMHQLMTAENFDAPAVQALVTKMVQAQITHKVEMARISNQMYNMLTSEQKAILNQKHEQVMQAVRQQMPASTTAPQRVEQRLTPLQQGLANGNE
ncbi:MULTISPECIES: cell-envelope stress modulator CpxP [Dickeya]|uniref:P pilus assembly/Cpx signaling pathway, periplasmic inhibitor/zinc-resistance associated protein n=1 Tax=Dickeya aquatica TaxID=1401087 RepID=A0A375A6K1_9GAMM|nr:MULTISPECIES: cell-envelope stress modulator CpxP [Dickeya]SLM61279.1 P pilus assembly/Cpx signaling pathway, periplasmic inhibitor/zinc-resistance associated protein [Dickeya aquatica]